MLYKLKKKMTSRQRFTLISGLLHPFIFYIAPNTKKRVVFTLSCIHETYKYKHEERYLNTIKINKYKFPNIDN